MSEKEVLMRDFKHAYAAIPDASPNEDGNGCKANAHAGRDLESLAGQPSERKSDSNRWRLFAACTALSCLALLVFLSAGEQRVDPAGSLEMGATPSPKTPSPYPNIVHPDPPTSLWGNVQRPYPTGAWWTNLVVGEGKDLIGVYPYALKTQESGVQVSYGASRRVVSKKSIVDPFVADLQLGTKEAYLSRAVEAHDALSVTMGYRTVGGKYKTHVVKSSPFVTVVYDNATPEITAELMQINSVEAREVKDSPGVKYIVTLGNWQKWLVYCSQPVALQWSGNKISSSGPIQGYVRVAILPVASYEKAFDELMQYVQRYPTCGSVEVVPALTTETESWLGGSTGAEATLVFKYSTVGAGELLMLALPHQQDGMLQPSLDSAVNIKALAYAPVWCIKGKMRAVVGDSWRLRVPLVSAGWNYEVSDKLSTARLDEIAQDLLQEMGARPIGAPDPYGFGKELGRMASLALIADDLGIATARQTAVEMLEAALGPWLLGDNSNSLNYDTTYGGLLTTNGLADKQGDYGQGWYNDHHFHFGYFMHGAAVIAKLDPTWFEVADRRQAIDAIAKDICNADPADPNYPFARHKDFFDGHSWASGLFTQGNGKGQESSSEAANAYYAVMLFASATQNEPLREFAHVLLSMEVQAAQKYWHMPDSSVYDGLFAASRMVGNMGAIDAVAGTWFGSNLEYVHGINIMPITPLTASLLDRSFVERQFPVLEMRLQAAGSEPFANASSSKETAHSPPSHSPLCSAHNDCAGLEGQCCPNPEGVYLTCCLGNSAPVDMGGDTMTDEWQSLLYCDLAVVDREAAWEKLLRLGDFGAGNSKTNALYWAASRPTPLAHFDRLKTPLGGKLVESECAANVACDAIGMVGLCCPLASGDFLGCCPSVHE